MMFGPKQTQTFPNRKYGVRLILLFKFFSQVEREYFPETTVMFFFQCTIFSPRKFLQDPPSELYELNLFVFFCPMLQHLFYRFQTNYLLLLISPKVLQHQFLIFHFLKLVILSIIYYITKFKVCCPFRGKSLSQLLLIV